MSHGKQRDPLIKWAQERRRTLAFASRERRAASKGPRGQRGRVWWRLGTEAGDGGGQEP